MNNRKIKHAALSAPVAGLELSPFAKVELIRKFQRKEGNLDCCASVYIRVCKQLECLWRDDCQSYVQYENGHVQNT